MHPNAQTRLENLLAENAMVRAEVRRSIVRLQGTIDRVQTLQETLLKHAPKLKSAIHGEKTRSTGLDSLTRREEEVLRLVAEGKSTKQIAGALGISFKTAVCHRSRIMQKLDIHETATLVRYAIRHGVIAP